MQPTLSILIPHNADCDLYEISLRGLSTFRGGHLELIFEKAIPDSCRKFLSEETRIVSVDAGLGGEMSRASGKWCVWLRPGNILPSCLIELLESLSADTPCSLAAATWLMNRKSTPIPLPWQWKNRADVFDAWKADQVLIPMPLLFWRKEYATLSKNLNAVDPEYDLICRMAKIRRKLTWLETSDGECGIEYPGELFMDETRILAARKWIALSQGGVFQTIQAGFAESAGGGTPGGRLSWHRHYARRAETLFSNHQVPAAILHLVASVFTSPGRSWRRLLQPKWEHQLIKWFSPRSS